MAGGRYDGLMTQLGSPDADSGGRLLGLDRRADPDRPQGRSASHERALRSGRSLQGPPAGKRRGVLRPRRADAGEGRAARATIAARIAGLDNVEVAYLSASEIASQLARGMVHLGVTGEDLVRENIADADKRVLLIDELGFG